MAEKNVVEFGPGGSDIGENDIFGVVTGVNERTSEKYGTTSFINVGSMSFIAPGAAKNYPAVGELVGFRYVRRGQALLVTHWTFADIAPSGLWMNVSQLGSSAGGVRRGQ